MKDPSLPERTWSLVVAALLILLSLWALHRFCDAYTEVALRQRSVPEDAATVAEPVCSRWLGASTGTGAAGIACLLGAWLLRRFSRSSGLLRISSSLAVIGRLIALGSLAGALLLVVLFNLF